MIKIKFKYFTIWFAILIIVNLQSKNIITVIQGAELIISVTILIEKMSLNGYRSSFLTNDPFLKKNRKKIFERTQASALLFLS